MENMVDKYKKHEALLRKSLEDKVRDERRKFDSQKKMIIIKLDEKREVINQLKTNLNLWKHKHAHLENVLSLDQKVLTTKAITMEAAFD